ncbi:serine/threonine-protein kinase [Cryptosporangium arvum]|uniref:serine/threonine-protein kinase n=1 Tax=Cryptosporangium arvum TaxID=80871 RepID=UPI0004B19752|nr:serine/threonine-protein kinase [Cryptosporangium arvum]
MSAPTVGQLGQYKLVGVLGSGGMGTVYLGRSPGGRPAAVKAVHGHLAINPDFRTRFRREVALAQRVGGPYTAAMLDADPDGDPPWLATEYIRGQSLSQVLTEHGALPEHTVRALAAGLAEALQVIHAAGVVHRDLKPSNVLLSENGPRVIDFGIAKAVEGIDLTGDGPLLGTPGYMSPEHLAGSALAPSSDVFSLGAVLAHAATGMAPFGAGQSFAVANRVSTAPPDLSGLPTGLAELIGKCLAKEPGERPSMDWIVRQVGSFAEQDSWLPSEVGNAIRHRPAPTRPFTSADAPPPGMRDAADDAPPDIVEYLADRFARRSGGAPIVPVRSSERPVALIRPKPAGAPAPDVPPAELAVAKLKEGAARLQGAAARLKSAARPAAPVPAVDVRGPSHAPAGYAPGRPAPGNPQAGNPAARGGPAAPHQRAPWQRGPLRPDGNPAPQRDARSAAVKAPRRVPWQRLQCPPIGTPTGRRAWSRWMLVLILIALLDAVAQTPAVRELVGSPSSPPWLAGAFEASSAIGRVMSGVPDPITGWIKEGGAATRAVRLAVIPLLLLAFVALIRRGGTSSPMMVAKTAAGWLGTALALLLACRYFATGFASLVWAVDTLGWLLIPTAIALAVITSRLAGKAR